LAPFLDDPQVPQKPEPTGVKMSDIPGGSFTLLAAGGEHTCGLASDGSAWCWGLDDSGQLGNDDELDNKGKPVPVDMSVMDGATFVDLAAGGFHTCGITDDGKAWCWGIDTFGQLGHGEPWGYRMRPDEVDLLPFAGRKMASVTAGAGHTCILAEDGTAFCAGHDVSGQVGNGPYLSRSGQFSQVDGANLEGRGFVQIDAGGDHTCGLTEDGSCFCWGDNTLLGAVADSGFGYRPLPVDLSVLDGAEVVSIMAGGTHTCVLTATGVPWCWGEDKTGQLGDDDQMDDHRNTAVPVDTSAIGNPTFVQVAPGNWHTCGLTDDGLAFCWGNDDLGSLGDGRDEKYTSKPLPVPVTMAKVQGGTLSSIVSGDFHSCGLSSSGAAWCWGKDEFGQIGD